MLQLNRGDTTARGTTVLFFAANPVAGPYQLLFTSFKALKSAIKKQDEFIDSLLTQCVRTAAWFN